MVSYIFKGLVSVLVFATSTLVCAGGGPPSDTEHQIGVGDTLESIAKKYAGDEKHVDVIRDMNPHLDEVGLQVGDYLYVPDDPLSVPKEVNTARRDRLPPSPIRTPRKTKVIPGVKFGLAHVYRPGGFKIVPAPVDKD